jgi:PAT family beta-lactamase induction signal transducer AmpG
MPRIHRDAPIWLMGLSNTTFGLVAGFIVLPLPQLLAAQAVSPAKIAAVSSACLFPGFWVFFLGPLLDLRFSRRAYATAFALLAGALLTLAILLRTHLLALEIALMLSYAAAVLSSNALGGWLAGILPLAPGAATARQDSDRASLSAWTQVGNFIGNGLMAGLAAEALRVLPLTVAAPLLGLLVILPAAIFPFMPAERTLPDQTTLARESFRTLFHDLAALFRRRDLLLTLLLFLAPTGAFALTNQLSGVAADFHASDAFVSRIGGAVLTVAGAASCLLLPVFARWVRPLPLYLAIGTTGSLFTLALLLVPATPAAFALAFLAENVAQALSFTAAVAICFEIIGPANPLAATQFSFLTSATVLPIVYMGILDGRVYSGVGSGVARLHGLHAMYAVDGTISLAACVALYMLLRRLSSTGRAGALS